jgi:predicted nucleic-acid-binding Zn-ribbon protein
MQYRLPQKCIHCDGTELYTRRVASAGGWGPGLLKGLGNFLYTPKFDVVVCATCGYCSFFVEEQVLEKLKPGNGWVRTNAG